MDEELEFMTRSFQRRATGVATVATRSGGTRREVGALATAEEGDLDKKTAVSSAKSSRVFEKVAKATEGNMFVAFEVFITLLLVWNCFEIPFRVAFLPLLQPLPVAFLIVASVIDWFFIFDCVLRFFKPYMHRRGYIVRDRTEIRRNYLRSWFVFDFLSSIPWDFMVLIIQQASPRIIENDIFLDEVRNYDALASSAEHFLALVAMGSDCEAECQCRLVSSVSSFDWAAALAERV